MGFIYLISCSHSQRVYIGQEKKLGTRWRAEVKAALRGSKGLPRLFDWLRKWLPSTENEISVEVLQACETREELDLAERKWISFYREKLGRDLVLNVSDGGNSQPEYHHPEEIRWKCGANRGKPAWNRGQKRKYKPNPKISLALKGVPKTQEHNKKVSEAKKKWWTERKMQNVG